jgi:hypothetical protein
MRARFRWSVGSTALLLSVALLVGWLTPPTPAQPAKRAAGLELVPTEGFAVVSVNVAALHDSDTLKPLRDALEMGDKVLLKRLEADAGMTPDQVDRLTAFLPAASASLADSPLVLVTTRKPLERAKVLKAWKATTEPSPNAQFGGLGGQFGLMGGGAILPGGNAQPVPVPVPDAAAKPKEDKPGKEPPLDLNAPLYYVDHGTGVLIPIDDRTLAYLPNQGFGGGGLALAAALLRRKADGPLADALAVADKHHVVAAVEGKHLREAVKQVRAAREAALMVPMFDMDGNQIPPKPKDPDQKLDDEFTPYEPLFQLDRAVLTFDLGATAKVGVTARYPDPPAAAKAEPVAKEGVRELVRLLTEERGHAAGTPADADTLPLFDFALAGLGKAAVKADGSTLTVTAAADVTSALKTALLSVPRKVQEAADRVRAQNNLKQIGLAVHSYHDANGFLPRDVTDADGKVLLSWRVQLLPHLEANDLYTKIDKSRAWDDPANQKLWDKMPDVFRMPGREPKEKGHTYVRAVHAVNWVGSDDVWMVDNKSVTLTDVTDGASQTVAALETEEAVNWMQPGDLPYDPKKLPAIGDPKTGKANALMLDGSVVTLDRKKFVGNKLIAVLTANGGEEVDLSDR